MRKHCLTCSAVMGSSSAVGVASMKSLRMGISKSSDAQAINRFRSTLLMDPIGLISADEQSYFVRSAPRVSLVHIEFSTHTHIRADIHRR